MRPGMEFLLEILRGGDARGPRGDADWNAMLALADEEHVLPWAASRRRGRHHEDWAQARAARLAEITRDAGVASFYWSCELKRLLHTFAQHGIKVVPLKGPYLAERVYGDAALRGCCDLDVLVGGADLARAEALLAEMGFDAGEADDYHRSWALRGMTVELHFDVENRLAFDFDVGGALRRAEAGEFQGEACLKLAPEDELLFLCLHGTRHRYERLSLVLDLRLAFDRLLRDREGWHPRAEVRELDGLIALGLAMARKLDPDFHAPRLDLRVTAAHIDHLGKVADGLWHELMTQSSEPLDWSAAHAFFVQLEPTAWARLRRRGRHLRILAGRVIEADMLFAARFGMHRTWQAWLLRPMRVLAETVQGRRRES
jgi:hypothetical protein